MNILLVGNFAPDAQESMLRFERLLHDGYKASGHSVNVISPQPFYVRLAGTYRYRGLSKYLGYIDKFVHFPRALRRRLRQFAPDVVHILDHSNAIYQVHCRAVPRLLTCHDVMAIQAARGEFPGVHVGKPGRRYQEWILTHLRSFTRVACVSSATASELRRLTAISADRLSVVPNALNFPYELLARDEAIGQIQRFFPTGLAAQFASSPGGFVLHVGGDHWYKNRPGLLAIFAHLRSKLNPPPSLIMVGKSLSAEETGVLRTLGIADAVVVCSSVSNPELQALYNAAECLIFPSWHEGFGWPIAEAQACGCPVFTTDRAPMNQVGGRSAVYFNPEGPEQAAEIISSAWASRAKNRQLGLEEAKRWRPQIMLDAYETLYRRCQQDQLSAGS